MDGEGRLGETASRPAQRNKTVLLLDGQAEANGTANFFVFREDEVRVRRRGETRRYNGNNSFQA